jgi:cytidine deaminase
MVIPQLLIGDSRLVSGLPQGWYQRMWEAACAASGLAYAPYSGFFVGAAVMSASGRIHVGCNVECVDYDGTHAEETALGALVMAGERVVSVVLGVARPLGADVSPVPVAPCGKCRQKIREFSDPRTVVLINVQSAAGPCLVPWTVDDLLPRSFGPEISG